MSTATILLGSVIATLIGSLFHLWKGGKAGRLLLYLVLSILGFWLGHILANGLGWVIDKLGQLHLAFGILGSLLFLFMGHWLSLIEKRTPSQ